MTVSTNQLRGFLLGGLLLCSILATVAYVPDSVAGEHEITDADIDGHLDSNDSYWGQTVWLQGKPNHEYGLWTYNPETGDRYAFSQIVRTDGDGVATLDTHGLNGEFLIYTAEDGPVEFEDGKAASTGAPAKASFNSTTQTLDAQFAKDVVSPWAERVDFVIESDRRSFAVEVSTDGTINEDKLSQIFESFDQRATADEHSIVITGVDNGTYDTDFTDVSERKHRFEFEAVDTGATSNDSVHVSHIDHGAIWFDDDVVQDQKGDVVTVTVGMENTDEGTIMIGSQEQEYWIGATLSDENEDGEVSVQFNTYTAGSSRPGQQKIWARGDDTAEFVTEGGRYTNTGGEPGHNRLESREYDMNVSISHDVLDKEERDPFHENAYDVGAISLQNRTINDVAVWTAPSGADVAEWDAGDVSLEADTNITESVEITEGDYVTLRIQASGVEGLLHETDDGPEMFNTDTGRLDIEPSNGSIVDDGSIDTSRPGAELITDAANDTYYVVLPADEESKFVNGTEYRATLAGDDEESESGSFAIVDRRTSLDTAEDDQILIRAGEDRVVSGETNRAPGTTLTLTVRVDDGSNAFVLEESTPVQSDGVFTFPVNVTSVDVGTRLSLIVGGEIYDGRITPNSGGSETGTTPAMGTTVPEITATERTEAATIPEIDTTTETTTTVPTDDNGPGFTVVAALGALIIAALLAGRRND